MYLKHPAIALAFLIYLVKTIDLLSELRTFRTAGESKATARTDDCVNAVWETGS